MPKEKKVKKEKKPAFTIHLKPADGDPYEIIEEIIRERINSVLRRHGAVIYDDKVPLVKRDK